jgi:hypothetical protein
VPLNTRQALDAALRSIMVPVEATVPYSAMDVLSQVTTCLRLLVVFLRVCRGVCVHGSTLNRPTPSCLVHCPPLQIFDRGSCDKVVYQTDGTYVAAQVPVDLATRLMQYRCVRACVGVHSCVRGCVRMHACVCACSPPHKPCPPCSPCYSLNCSSPLTHTCVKPHTPQGG